jgi:hypothetical protein
MRRLCQPAAAAAIGRGLAVHTCHSNSAVVQQQARCKFWDVIPMRARHAAPGLLQQCCHCRSVIATDVIGDRLQCSRCMCTGMGFVSAPAGQQRSSATSAAQQRHVCRSSHSSGSCMLSAAVTSSAAAALQLLSGIQSPCCLPLQYPHP